MSIGAGVVNPKGVPNLTKYLIVILLFIWFVDYFYGL